MPLHSVEDMSTPDATAPVPRNAAGSATDREFRWSPRQALRDSAYLFAGWWIHLLIAEGLTNRGIAKRLVVTEGAVEKHVQRIFTKLDLHTDGDEHRRVAAVLTFLRSS